MNSPNHQIKPSPKFPTTWYFISVSNKYYCTFICATNFYIQCNNMTPRIVDKILQLHENDDYSAAVDLCKVTTYKSLLVNQRTCTTDWEIRG